MKTTLDFSDFRDAFRRHDRLGNFSREGMQMLFDYCEEYDPDMELDVIALCCDYTEDTWQSIADNYGIEYDENENDDEGREVVREYLEANTIVVGETADGFVYAAF